MSPNFFWGPPGLRKWHFLKKPHVFDFMTHIPWTTDMSWVEKYWSHPLTNLLNIILVRRTCAGPRWGLTGRNRGLGKHSLIFSFFNVNLKILNSCEIEVTTISSSFRSGQARPIQQCLHSKSNQSNLKWQEGVHPGAGSHPKKWRNGSTVPAVWLGDHWSDVWVCPG